MKQTIQILLLTFAAALIFSTGFASEKKGEKHNFENIDYEALTKLIEEKKVTLIDCNGTESYKKGHIKGAIDGQSENISELLPKEKDSLLVAYCGSEKCPAWKSGANKAKKLGYTNIKHFSAGLKGWKEKGGTLEKAE